jgi:hypothetical protein
MEPGGTVRPAQQPIGIFITESMKKFPAVHAVVLGAKQKKGKPSAKRVLRRDTNFTN